MIGYAGWGHRSCPEKVALVASIFLVGVGDGDGDSAWSGHLNGFVLQRDDDDLGIQGNVDFLDHDLFVESQSAQVGEVEFESAISPCHSGHHVDGVLTAFPFTSVDDGIVMVVLD